MVKRYRSGRAAAMGLTEDDVCPRQLEMGIVVEYEHTDNREVAKQIALDHLAELPDYYTRLLDMESLGKLYWGIK